MWIKRANRIQGAANGRSVSRTSCRIFRETPHHQRGERLGNSGHDFLERLRLTRDVLSEELGRRRPGMWKLSRKHAVREYAKRIDIGACVRALAHGLLR